MKKVVDLEHYGKGTYDEELEIWKSTTPIEILFNGKIWSLDFYIEDATPLTTQYKFDNTSITLEPYNIESEQEDALEQKQLFDRYLKDSKDMAGIFSEAIIEDFNEARQSMFETDNGYRKNHFDVETIEKIKTADTPEKIFDMIHFKELTLGVYQIRIIGKSDYHFVDYGVSITSNGTVYAGSVEMIYC